MDDMGASSFMLQETCLAICVGVFGYDTNGTTFWALH